MRLRALQLSDGIDKVVKKAALAVDQAVVLATPVDTGRARSNWIVTVGAPAGGTRGPFSPGSKLGLGETGNATAAIAEAKAVINSKTPKQAIFISNNVNYIAELNNGSSRQAPKNFVNRAVKQGADEIRNVKIFEV